MNRCKAFNVILLGEHAVFEERFAHGTSVSAGRCCRETVERLALRQRADQSKQEGYTLDAFRAFPARSPYRAAWILVPSTAAAAALSAAAV